MRSCAPASAAARRFGCDPMDEQVKAALAKWPDVPDCTGWLALDARGRWRIGEAKAGPRQPITHAAMIAFINRNYGAHGRYWVFQNGPQRVYVELEYTPFVWRLVPNEQHAWDLVVAHRHARRAEFAVARQRRALPVRGARRRRGAGGRRRARPRHGDRRRAAARRGRCAAERRDADAAVDRRRRRARRDDAAATSACSGTRRRPTLRLPLRRIASHQVATRFGFEPRPAIALRVDVDTRR